MTVTLNNKEYIFNNNFQEYRNPQWEIDALRDVFKPVFRDGLVLDIGAGCGDSALALWSLAQDSKIVCFEPNLECFGYLKSNVIVNGLEEHFDYHNVAAHNDNCFEAFFFNGPNGGIVRGYSEEERGQMLHKLPVWCVNTTEFLVKKYTLQTLYEKLSFIKIDTEGQDAFILKNLEPLIKLAQPTVFMEWWFHESRNKDTFEAIRDIDYNAYNAITYNLVTEEDFKDNKCQDLILLPKNKSL